MNRSWMRCVTLPNAISVLRLPLAVVFVAAETVQVRGAVLAVGALTDWLDGWLARRLGARSRAGEILDPITDKTFVLAALGTFAAGGRLELWQLLVLLARDVYVAAAFVAARFLRLPIRFQARFGGKLVTTLQLLAILVLLVRPALMDWLLPAVAVASIYAVADYTRAGLAGLREDGEAA